MDLRLIFGVLGLLLVLLFVFAAVAIVMVLIKEIADGARLSVSIRKQKERHLATAIGGLVLTGYAVYSVLAGEGIDIFAALSGTLGIALISYSLGFDGMLNTIRGYFTRRK